MNRFKTLLLREWLQHRFGWAMMVLIPLALAVTFAGVGDIAFGDEGELPGPELLTLVMGLASIGATALLLTVIAVVASLITVVGLARRDHGDRSVEFWLSLPIGHSASFAAPLLVHLLVVPIAALAAGLLGGGLVSLVLVTRHEGLAAWWGLPWGAIASAAVALHLRLAAGLALALLWLAPLLMVTVLLVAWFRRWGLVILAAVLAFGGMEFAWFGGRPLIGETVLGLLRGAGMSLIHPMADNGIKVSSGEQVVEVLGVIPGMLLENFGRSLGELASVLLLGGLIVAAGCFALLVDWRRRGAMAGS